MAIVRFTLKDPDGVYESLKDAGFAPGDMDAEENAEIRDVFEKFVEYSEYVTIELDTVLNTARVVPLR